MLGGGSEPLQPRPMMGKVAGISIVFAGSAGSSSRAPKLTTEPTPSTSPGMLRARIDGETVFAQQMFTSTEIAARGSGLARQPKP